MLRDGKFMICTMQELAKWLYNTIDNDPWGNPNYIADVDFTLLPITEPEIQDYSAGEIESRCEGWYGIKSVDTGMDSSWLNVVADIYGGGTAEIITIFERDKGALDDLEILISRVLQANEGTNCDENLLFVETKNAEETK